MSKLWLNYENWSKQENQNRLYRYKSNMYRYKLVKNDHNRNCTGTSSTCTGTSSTCTGTSSTCTGTSSTPKSSQNVCFSPISPYFDTQSTLPFKHTSKPFQISFGISFLFNSSFISYLLSKPFHEFIPNSFQHGL